MSDYFDPPQAPTDPNQWTPPPGQQEPAAWPGGSPPAAPSGLWRADRPRPRLGALVGVVAGVLLAGGLVGLLAELGEEGDPQAVVAGLVAAAAVAGAVVALPRLPRGPMTVAAVTAAFLLTAAPMGFWLTTADEIGAKSAASLFLLAPTAVWAGTFLVGATRGRPVFLAGALAGLWLLLSVLAVDTGGSSSFGSSSGTASTTSVVMAQESPEDVDGDGIPDEFDPDFVDPDQPDADPPALDSDGDGIPDEFDSEPFDRDNDGGSGSGSGNAGFDPLNIVPGLFGVPLFGAASAGSAVGVVALLFGIGYLAVAGVLDRSDRSGSATPFQAVGIAALLTALSALANDLGEVGTSLGTVAVGAGLLWLGTVAARRLTAWLGTLLGFVGLAALIFSAVDDQLAASVLLVVLGAGVLAGAHALLGGDTADGDPAAGPPGEPGPAGDPWTATSVVPPTAPPFA